MAGAQFEYVIYVRATPEQVETGLVDPAFTRQYRMQTTCPTARSARPGRSDAAGTIDIVGEVIESEPHRRLVLENPR